MAEEAMLQTSDIERAKTILPNIFRSPDCKTKDCFMILAVRKFLASHLSVTAAYAPRKFVIEARRNRLTQRPARKRGAGRTPPCPHPFMSPQ